MRILRFHSHPKAWALLFMIILSTVIILTASGISGLILSGIEQSKDLFLSEQAYYAARATLEKGIANAVHQGIGYEGSNDAAISWDLNADGTVDVTGEYDIFARAKRIDWDWENSSRGVACNPGKPCYVPIPGSGSAGTGCDFENTDQDWNGDKDDECNWNRSLFG